MTKAPIALPYADRSVTTRESRHRKNHESRESYEYSWFLPLTANGYQGSSPPISAEPISAD